MATRAALLLILALLLLDGYLALGSAKANLSEARDALRRGADALAQGDATRASQNFQLAAEAAADAETATHRPSFLLARLISPLRDDVDAARTIARSAQTTAGAAGALAQAAIEAGWNGEGIDASLLAVIGPALEKAASDLQKATEELRGVRVEGLFGPVREAVLEARGELEGRADLASKATDLAALLPSFLQEDRRYLLVVQSLSEPRGTGGSPDVFGSLRVRAGELRLEGLLTPERRRVHPVPAPEDFRDRWGMFGATTQLSRANLSPDLPTSARVILRMAKEQGWGAFDGILMIDEVWMAYMLDATGPIETTAWPEEITRANAVTILGHDVFEARRSRRKERAIQEAFWEAVETRRLSADALTTALSRGTLERHLQIFSTEPSEQELLNRLGADGSATLGANPIYVVWSTLSESKAGWFQERRVDVHVELIEGGWARVTTTIRLRNRADSSPAGELLGRGEDHEVGAWAPLVSVYLPEELEGLPDIDYEGPGDTGMEREFGRPVAFGALEVPSHRATTWSVGYVVPGAWQAGPGGGGRYQMDFLPQPATTPIPFRVTIVAPEGFSPIEGSPGMILESEEASWSDTPATAQSIWVEFA